MADWPFSAAIRAVREGLSARAGLSAFRGGGGSIRDATWFRAYSEAKSAVAGRERELAAPQNRAPSREELQTWTTRGAAGILQQVEVFVRDLATGEVVPIPYSVTSDAGVSRQIAIGEALGAIADEAEGYGQVVLGAAHVGAFEMVPGGE